MTATRGAADVLLHPLTLVSLTLLVLNDHVLKHACPSAFTGKLSDVAGLVLFPLLLIAGREVLLPACAPSRAWVAVCVIATGVVFASIKLSPTAADLYRVALAVVQWPFRAVLAMRVVPLAPVRHCMDPTDLLALPALLVPTVLAWARAGAAIAGDGDERQTP